jgi:hypothetical protein
MFGTNGTVQSRRARMKSLIWSTAVLLMLSSLSSVAQERGLEFLKKIPEFRDLSFKMSEDQLASHVSKQGLYAKKTLKNERVSYWLLTTEGENVFVTFTSGKCAGIQRMQPIPKQMIEESIGTSAYRAWMAERKKAELGPKRDRQEPAP